MLTATLLAVGSAFVHASWNLLIKSSDDRALASWGQFLMAGVLGGVAMLVVGAPGWEAVPYLARPRPPSTSSTSRLSSAAYVHGDFSLAYPLAAGRRRGAGCHRQRRPPRRPPVDRVVGRDRHRRRRPLLPPPARRSADSRGRLAYAALTAAAIASYTLVDSAGSRAVASGLSYGARLGDGVGDRHHPREPRPPEPPRPGRRAPARLAPPPRRRRRHASSPTRWSWSPCASPPSAT